MLNYFTKIRSGYVLLLGCLILLPALVFAAGSLNGRIVDAETGDYLPGANIYLEGTSIGAATDREGFYRITNVPEGTYTLKVNYIGYEDYSSEITVTSGRMLMDDIKLQNAALQTETIVSEGLREGQVKAINQQRMAPNIKNIVAREQMERFPDDNVANVVKRLPGIYIARSNGEGRYVHIRGTDPRLSTISVNGEKLPSTRQEERYASLDIIGANQASSIEVVKAITPDMDGDAIGGNINIITPNAFDYKGQRIRITAGSGYGELAGNALYQFKGSYSNLFGEDKNIGLTITANFNRSDRGAHGQEYDWADGEEDVNDNVMNNPAVGGEWVLDEMDLREYNVVRDNIGFGATLDYRLNESNRFYLRGTWNQFDDDTHRGRWRIRVSSGNYLTQDGTVTERSRLEIESQDRTEENNMSQYSFGGVSEFGDIEMDYNLAYSTAFEKTQPGIETNFRYDGRVGMQLSGLGSDDINWNLTDTPNEEQYDPSLYQLREFDVRDRVANNKSTVAGVNFSLPTEIAGYATEIKFGGKVQMSEKDRNDDRYQYSWEGDDDVFLDQFDPQKADEGEFLDEYTYAPLGTEKAYTDFYNEYKNSLLEAELDWWDSEGQTFDATEDIYAAYAMATLNVGKLMILAGIRNEFTQTEYTGTQLNYDADGDYLSHTDSSLTKDYNHVLPNLHFRYSFTPMTNMRLAFTRAIARPNYWDLAPRREIDPDGPEIVSGNADLLPTTSFNIDLMAEHYFQGIGIASGGLFYKKMDDIIFTVTKDIVGGVYDGYEEERPVNGGSADLFGVELNWNQQLTFLPGFLDGFGIYANYTHIWAKADLSDDVINSTFSSEDDFKERDDVLPGQTGDMLNFALSYEKFGFSGRLSITYQGEFVEEVGKSKEFDEWRDDHLQIDFSATQDIIEGLKAYVEMINLTDEPERIYLGRTSRPIQREFYSWWMRVGLKASL